VRDARRRAANLGASLAARAAEDILEVGRETEAGKFMPRTTLSPNGRHLLDAPRNAFVVSPRSLGKVAADRCARQPDQGIDALPVVSCLLSARLSPSLRFRLGVQPAEHAPDRPREDADQRPSPVGAGGQGHRNPIESFAVHANPPAIRTPNRCRVVARAVVGRFHFARRPNFITPRDCGRRDHGRPAHPLDQVTLNAAAPMRKPGPPLPSPMARSSP
jgi:hypothetical protein